MITTLLPQIEAYVIRFFHEHPHPQLVYHTLKHTREVVDATEQLAQHYQLAEADFLAVMAAAWFHDLGYLTSSPTRHEEAGADLATRFLQQADASAEVITSVQQCIRATRMPQSPTNLLGEILCDADLFHLGQDIYPDKQKLLRKEKENLTGADISGRDWRQQNMELLQQHRYFTIYAQTLLMKGQAGNLRLLTEKQAEKKAKNGSVTEPQSTLPSPDLPLDTPGATDASESAKKVGKNGKEKRTDRGIETMFRTTSTNHLRLSEIADSKANIMVSVNSIMVSVIVSILPRRIEENPNLLLPTALFLTTALVTIVAAILATRPHVTQGTFSREDIRQKRGNLLFFGNFHQMSLADYEWGINELMQDSNYLYSTMTRDIYYLGRVLGKKYKLLRLAYSVFMIGFVVSILAFLIVFLFFSK